jgi:hypothetical protein
MFNWRSLCILLKSLKKVLEYGTVTMMEQNVGLYLYAALWGFFMAGFLSSFYQLVTSRPPQFMIYPNNRLASLFSLTLSFILAPYIVMRNALRARLFEGRPWPWLAASSIIVFFWSMCLGIVSLSVIQFIL